MLLNDGLTFITTVLMVCPLGRSKLSFGPCLHPGFIIEIKIRNDAKTSLYFLSIKILINVYDWLDKILKVSGLSNVPVQL